MKKLNDLMLVPPGGWRWTCAKHGTKLQAGVFYDLLLKVNGYLRANDIQVHGDRVAWLQNELCEQHGWGPETCSEVDA
jgi:hypothetical protein